MENEKQTQKEQDQVNEENLTIEELDEVNGGLVPFPRIHYPLVGTDQTDSQFRRRNKTDLLAQ